MTATLAPVVATATAPIHAHQVLLVPDDGSDSPILGAWTAANIAPGIRAVVKVRHGRAVAAALVAGYTVHAIAEGDRYRRVRFTPAPSWLPVPAELLALHGLPAFQSPRRLSSVAM